MGSIQLRIEGTTGDSFVKFAWAIGPNDDASDYRYKVARSELLQASEQLRVALRKLAMLSNLRPDKDSARDSDYARALRAISERGAELRENIFHPVDGNIDIAREVKDLLEEQALGDESSKAAITILLGDEQILVPWSFVAISDTNRTPPPIKCSMEDFSNFWLHKFRLTVKYQGGKPSLPKNRRDQHKCVFALHEDLFSQAKSTVERANPDAAELHRDVVMDDDITDNDWYNIRSRWADMKDDFDSIVYVFGHSDGEQIILNDSTNADGAVLPVSGFARTFEREPNTPTASICILNGCRTGAPAAVSPWPATFVKATRGNGFYGFIGTETEIANDSAHLFGLKLLKRLRVQGESLGDAFDAVRHEERLFPSSLLYSCFANRDFRVPSVPAGPCDGGALA